MIAQREYRDSDFLEVVNIRLKPIDELEVRAFSGKTPVECLALSIEKSQIKHVITINGKIEGAFGMGIVGTIGVPWLLSSTEVFATTERRCAFKAGAPHIITDWKTRVVYMNNCISKQNRIAIRWLKSLGFEIDEKILHLRGVDFYSFFMWTGANECVNPQL